MQCWSCSCMRAASIGIMVFLLNVCGRHWRCEVDLAITPQISSKNHLFKKEMMSYPLFVHYHMYERRDRQWICAEPSQIWCSLGIASWGGDSSSSFDHCIILGCRNRRSSWLEFLLCLVQATVVDIFSLPIVHKDLVEDDGLRVSNEVVVCIRIELYSWFYFLGSLQRWRTRL